MEDKKTPKDQDPVLLLEFLGEARVSDEAGSQAYVAIHDEAIAFDGWMSSIEGRKPFRGHVSYTPVVNYQTISGRNCRLFGTMVRLQEVDGQQVELLIGIGLEDEENQARPLVQIGPSSLVALDSEGRQRHGMAGDLASLQQLWTIVTSHGTPRG
jgi:hypothetical protein